MKLNFLERVESEYAVLFEGKKEPLHRSLIPLILRLLTFFRLIIRVLVNGYQPRIHQSRDREQNICWYVYYPISGISKFIASDAEIKQWLELTQEI